MMSRPRSLPRPWYPESPSETEALLEGWSAEAPEGGALAAVGPHAGWSFSGRLAWRSFQALAEAETVAVIGGHLRASAECLAAPEESFDTPLGPIAADLELKAALAARIALQVDRAADNTVEIQLPMARRRYPGARLLWLRAPNGPRALALGAALAEAARGLGRRVTVFGSTDLTHYGPDYGFEPAGRGPEAEAWVRERNDRAFLEALAAMDAEKALELGEGEGAACSSGAAAAAIAFARASGAGRAAILGYGTSLELRRAASFVGYGSVAFYR